MNMNLKKYVFSLLSRELKYKYLHAVYKTGQYVSIWYLKCIFATETGSGNRAKKECKWKYRSEVKKKKEEKK